MTDRFPKAVPPPDSTGSHAPLAWSRTRTPLATWIVSHPSPCSRSAVSGRCSPQPGAPAVQALREPLTLTLPARAALGTISLPATQPVQARSDAGPPWVAAPA